MLSLINTMTKSEYPVFQLKVFQHEHGSVSAIKYLISSNHLDDYCNASNCAYDTSDPFIISSSSGSIYFCYQYLFSDIHDIHSDIFR